MTRTLHIRSAAEQDLRAAANWYDEQRIGLGLVFMDAVAEVAQRIRSRPSTFPTVSHGAKRALVKRFPYAVYFDLTDERITVLAIVHQHRRPQDWRRR